jgi:DNA-binding transcriptional MerR regulator
MDGGEVSVDNNGDRGDEKILNMSKKLKDSDPIKATPSSADRIYTISELSAEFDVTTRTLRFYEDKGLLSPRRRGTTRIYRQRDFVRLKYVLLAKRIGLSLDDVKELLDLYDIRDGAVSQTKAAIEKFNQRIKELATQRADIDEQEKRLQLAISDAQAILSRLKSRN